MEIRELVTHDGKFHADEVMSTVILTDLFPKAGIFRSRDPRMTSPAPGRVVYDVGGAFDPAKGLFDHHQQGSPKREDGTDYSSFGLVWDRFGREWLAAHGVSAEDADAVWLRIDRQIVSPIDAADTGAVGPDSAGVMRRLTVQAMIDDMSPVFDEPWDENVGYAFAAAVDLCRTTLTNRAKAISADLRAERAVTAAIRDSWPSPILELPFGMPYNKAIRDAEADHVMLVVIPRGEDWTVGTVRDGSGDYTNRMDLPEAWAGLSGQDLCDAVGADDAVFCHKARFIAVAKSRGTAMMMASLALDAAPEPE